MIKKSEINRHLLRCLASGLSTSSNKGMRFIEMPFFFKKTTATPCTNDETYLILAVVSGKFFFDVVMTFFVMLNHL